MPSRSLVFGLFERRRIGQLSRSQGPLQRDNGLAKPGVSWPNPLLRCTIDKPNAPPPRRSRQKGPTARGKRSVGTRGRRDSQARLCAAPRPGRSSDLIFRMPKVDVVSLVAACESTAQYETSSALAPARRTEFMRRSPHILMGRASCDYFFARASSANLTNILRNSPGPVTRSGKSSRKVLAPACRSIPSGSHPVQRQSSGAAPSSLVA